jgi:DNA polymerase IV
VRLWAKKKKSWKFDSSGITDRTTGENLNIEAKENANPVQAEKSVFEKLGLEYVPPTLRNTG